MNYNPQRLESLIESAFPETYGDIYDRTVEINPQNVESFASLVKINLGEFYSRINGIDWFDDKVIEMQERGLVYVSYKKNNEVIGFVSFVDTWDDEDGRVLYLYEIQISPNYQGEGLGKKLIESFHKLALKMSKTDLPSSGNITGYLNNNDDKRLSATKLTVFSENKVVNWYKNLGYLLSEDSPRDRKLRNGKIIKPDYYLMVRKV